MKTILKNSKKDEKLSNNNNNRVHFCCEDNFIKNCCHFPKSSSSEKILAAESIMTTTARNDNALQITMSSNLISESAERELAYAGELLINDDNEDDDVALSSDSTDNLSYSSDNCMVEELIVSDDELQNSDDCIYAYRGDGDLMIENHVIGINGGLNGIQNNGLQNNNHIDDETDFLEMDFEPDPPSEIEDNQQQQQQQQHQQLEAQQLDDCKLLANNSNNHNDYNQTNYSTSSFNDINQYKFDTNQTQLQHYPNIEYKMKSVEDSSVIYQPNTLSLQSSNETNENSPQTESLNTKTGTKRKKLFTTTNQLNKISLSASSSSSSSSSSPSSSSLPSSSSTPSSSNVNGLSVNNASTSLNRSGRYSKSTALIQEFRNSNEMDIEEDEEICLDCLEKEFVLKTTGKIIKNSTEIECRKCASLNRIRKQQICRQRQQQQQRQLLLDYRSGYNNSKKACSSREIRSLRPEFQENMQYDLLGNNLLVNGGNYSGGILNTTNLIKVSSDICHVNNIRETVRFSTYNVTEKTVIQALEKLHLTYNKQIIMEYFKSQSNEVEEHLDDITEFIIHISKKNCDYKNIIKLIKMSCREELHIEFVLNEYSELPQFCYVSVAGILHRWSPESDLSKLQKLNNKRFREMNVLGKIVNLLRLVHQKNKTPMIEFIQIPQYYKDGTICITKLS